MELFTIYNHLWEPLLFFGDHSKLYIICFGILLIQLKFGLEMIVQTALSIVTLSFFLKLSSGLI